MVVEEYHQIWFFEFASAPSSDRFKYPPSCLPNVLCPAPVPNRLRDEGIAAKALEEGIGGRDFCFESLRVDIDRLILCIIFFRVERRVVVAGVLSIG
jgi:hypothetical protein